MEDWLLCPSPTFLPLAKASSRLALVLTPLTQTISDILDQAQTKASLRALPLHRAGTNSYSGLGLFSKLGYMMVNKFFSVFFFFFK